MTAFKFSLPTDIPWRRICVSSDMLDPIVCDDERPPKWRSSMAVFRYDPAEDYQPYENEAVTYLKVVTTITPFQPEVDLSKVKGFLPPQLIDEIEESFPTYGAVLQVSVAPREQDMRKYPRERYPYFIDCEPKKRELFEAVTQTGEVLFGSSESLSVGKSSTNTNSMERYDLDMGGGGGGSILFGLVSAEGQTQEQRGTVARSGHEVQNVRTTDSTTERRELQSHTTNLTQMYNLFQAFHIATNRILFLIEPRPHIMQTESTFINGPRALEGVQEVFLVVVRPKDMDQFCVSAYLETAHLTKAPVETQETKQDVVPIRFTTGREARHFVEDYFPDPGYEFDLDQYNQDPNWLSPNEVVNSTGASPSVTKDYARMDVHLGRNGVWDFDFTRYMKRKEAEVTDYVRTIYMSARELCCCPPTRRLADADYITRTVDVSRFRWPIYRGPGNPRSFNQSRRMASRVRDEMVRGFRSSRRHERGQVPYDESEAFNTRVADLLRTTGTRDRLRVPLSRLRGLTPAQREALAEAIGDVDLDRFLDTRDHVLAGILDLTADNVRALKGRLLRGLGKSPNGAQSGSTKAKRSRPKGK